ncbi:unnamed protein product [Trichogramma brassicae]|uniref:Uncharacterized protein n=1 Tax=Trichogramma brassicae TaxID=86971 RepID=A0A6H5IWJ9_9HYME|nr:unnamed protein product [Trichogramma brassicae]
MSIRGYECQRVAGIDEKKLERLKNLHSKVNWQIDNERYEFLDRIDPLISDWNGQLPDLRDTFLKEQIDRLLVDCASATDEDKKNAGKRFVEFVARSGYTDEPDLDQDGKPIFRRATALHKAAFNNFRVVEVLFKIYNRGDVNYVDEDGYSHFLVACEFGLVGFVKKFLDCGVDPDLQLTKESRVPLVAALDASHRNVAELLLRHGADPNKADTNGLTPLHVISCKRDNYVSIATLLFETSGERHRRVQIDAQDVDGKTPLHFAIHYGNANLVEFLLRRGADLNLADEDGRTYLHYVCAKDNDEIDMARLIFEIADEQHRQVRVVDAQSNFGEIPLHLALCKGNAGVAELLLRRGADPNLANSEGDTALHAFCKGNNPDPDLTEMLFDPSHDEYRTVLIDAQNGNGATPLHYALLFGFWEVAKLLMKSGANMNLASKKGFTPLHIVCIDDFDDKWVKLFFEMCDEFNRLVLVDAKDNEGLTPLQWVVAYLLPNAVDVLLNRGADLSNFVFPNENYFGKELDVVLSSTDCFENKLEYELDTVTRLLPVINRLEEGGYKLDREGALTIMKVFAKYEMFEKSRDLEEYNFLEDEEFLAKAKNIMVKPDLSFYDAIWLRPREAAKLLTPMDYSKLGEEFHELPESQKKACVMHLCEKATRRFFQRWALEPFWELIHHRLPIECCDMILEQLTNEDLCNICFAAAGQS